VKRLTLEAQDPAPDHVFIEEIIFRSEAQQVPPQAPGRGVLQAQDPTRHVTNKAAQPRHRIRRRPATARRCYASYPHGGHVRLHDLGDQRCVRSDRPRGGRPRNTEDLGKQLPTQVVAQIHQRRTRTGTRPDTHIPHTDRLEGRAVISSYNSRASRRVALVLLSVMVDGHLIELD